MTAGTIGHLLRRSAERLLSRTGCAAVARWRRRGRTLVLAYHNIVPHGAEPGADRALHLPQARFARQLDLLQRYCEVVSLEEALAAAEARPRGGARPQVAITFDDAYRGALTAGILELRARGMPATIFVAPGALGRAFWWDEYLLERPAERRELAIGEFRGEGERVRAHAERSEWRRALVPPHAMAASFDEITAVLDSSRLTLGSHTWSHPVLPSLVDAELGHELAAPMAWLREHFPGVTVPVIAYPYGLVDERVARAAAGAGYHAGLRVDGGWITAHLGDRFQLPRINVPGGVSDEGFILRISGMIRR